MRSAARLANDFAVTVVGAFGLATAALLFAGAEPLSAFSALFRGSLGSLLRLGYVVNAWIPLTLCACGLIFTFRIGLWNIGVEGQVMMGAVWATWALRCYGEGGSPVLTVAAAFAAGMAGGALWALLAGYLKTKGGVHEIFTGLGLNFVAQAVILWLIFGPWKRAGVASMSGTETFSRDLWLPAVTAMRLSPAGLVLVIAALVLTAVLIRYSRMALRLKALGNNERAAPMFGLRPQAYMLLAMAVAGGFAGLAGTTQAAGVYHRLIPAISSNYGYLALLVVMLANYRVAAVPFVAFFFACLNVGSIQLPMVLEIDSSLSGVIQGALVLSALAVHGWRSGVTKQGRAP